MCTSKTYKEINNQTIYSKLYIVFDKYGLKKNYFGKHTPLSNIF